MDSSSDSDEFYECDDVLEAVGFKNKTIEVKPRQREDHKTLQTDNHNENNPNKTSEECNNNPAERRPEYGIPPARTTCWFPGVSPNIKLEESEIHPAYLENMAKSIKVTDADDKNVKTTEHQESVYENNMTKDTSCILNISKQAKDVIEPTSIDNIWDDNDNWGEDLGKEVEAKCTLSGTSANTTKQKEAVTNDNLIDKDNKRAIDSLKPKETLPKPSEVFQEDLWGDEDDWGKLETEQKPDPAEDLWGDGDGWNIDTPKATPSKTTPHNIKVNLESTNDLWAEGDSWDIDNTPEPPQNPQEPSAFEALASNDTSWSGWSNWGISSVLSTAANITTSVSQGLTTVLETGIGVPDPEDLARRHKEEELLRLQQHGTQGEEEQAKPEQVDDKGQIPFNLGNWVSGVSSITKLVETTGSKVITSGLGTLETIGKKTYEVLQENDPQLKRKRAFLKKLEGDKPVLSQILREAKERAEGENKERERKHFAKKANYETMFDDYQGLVHLEALEMLSKQCDIKLETIMAQVKDLAELQETMEQIKDLCELNTEEDEEEHESFEDLSERINTAVNDINIGISGDKLLETFTEILNHLENSTSHNPTEIHSSSIENLAKVTALAVEQYHKAGELLLVKEHRSTADEADSLVQLTTAISALIAILSTRYSEKLKSLVTESNNAEIKSFISIIFLEAANSSRYIEDAFSLLIPVIQVGAV